MRFTLCLSMATFAFSVVNSLRLKIGRDDNTILYQCIFLMKFLFFVSWYFETQIFIILGIIVLFKSQFIISLRERGELLTLSLMSAVQPLLISLYILYCFWVSAELRLNILIKTLLLSATSFLLLSACRQEIRKTFCKSIFQFSIKQYLRILGYMPVILLPFVISQMDRLFIISKFNDIILSEYGKFDVIAQIPYAISMMVLFYWHKLILSDDDIFATFKKFLRYRVLILLIMALFCTFIVYSSDYISGSDVLTKVSITLIFLTKISSMFASCIVIYWQRLNIEFRNSFIVLCLVLLIVFGLSTVTISSIEIYQLFHFATLVGLILVPIHGKK